jgi:transcriptional regulator with XRE-family HTH domain
MPFGERLKQARESAALTQQQAAEAAGVPQSYWSRLETGGRQNPSMDVLVRVARAVGVSLDDLTRDD